MNIVLPSNSPDFFVCGEAPVFSLVDSDPLRLRAESKWFESANVATLGVGTAIEKTGKDRAGNPMKYD